MAALVAGYLRPLFLASGFLGLALVSDFVGLALVSENPCPKRNAAVGPGYS